MPSSCTRVVWQFFPMKLEKNKDVRLPYSFSWKTLCWMSWITSRSQYPCPLVRSEQLSKQSYHSFSPASGGSEKRPVIRQQMWVLDLIGFGPIYPPGPHFLVCNIKRLDKTRMVSSWHVAPILQNFTFCRYFLTHQGFLSAKTRSIADQSGHPRQKVITDYLQGRNWLFARALVTHWNQEPRRQTDLN